MVVNDVAVQVAGLRFGYSPEHSVLDGIDLVAARGECLCLMGVNGCGKSTLLDCLLGVHEPSEGSVEVFGRSALGLPAAKLARLTAYVPQIHEKSFPYTVMHVVLMGRLASGSAFGAPDASDEQIAMNALERCGIAALAERPYTELSGGEVQMVMLARALAQSSPLIIMDEPTAHLDFRNELLFLETVESLVKNEGITVLMATHGPNQAFHLETAGIDVRVAVMAKGRIVRVGAPSEVLEPRLLRDMFGIESIVLEHDGEKLDASIRQLALLHTIKRDER